MHVSISNHKKQKIYAIGKGTLQRVYTIAQLSRKYMAYVTIYALLYLRHMHIFMHTFVDKYTYTDAKLNLKERIMKVPKKSGIS